MKMHYAAKNLRGKKFGLLTAIEPTGERRYEKVVWLCKCECGNETTATTGDLCVGYKRSCGCLVRKPLQQQPKLDEIKSITISKPILVKRILELAAQSGTSPKTWVETALEDFILKHRSGRMPDDPYRHTAQNEDTTANYIV